MNTIDNNLEDLGLVAVFRDHVQSRFGNEVPLDNPKFQRMAQLISEINAAGYPILEGVESVSGAQPRVALVNGRNPFDETRGLANALYSTPEAAEQGLTQRFLFRGAYVIGLDALSPPDQEHVIGQVVNAAGGEDKAVIKVFDSQNDARELETTFEIAAQRGFGIEGAITYAKDTAYDDQFYYEAARDYIKLFKYNNIQPVRISIKDMVGELDATEAQRVVELLRQAAFDESIHPSQMEIAVHSHDTGQAMEATTAFYQAAHQYGFKKIYVDVMHDESGTFPSIAGFLGQIAPEKITPKQWELIAELEELGAQLDIENDQYRLSGFLTGQERRQYHIPGGGEPALVNALLRNTVTLDGDNIATRIMGFEVNADNIRDPEVHAGVKQVFLEAYGQAWEDFGKPLPVTPGFKMVQDMAILALTNMSLNLEREQRGEEPLRRYENMTQDQKKFFAGKMPHELSEDARIEVGASRGEGETLASEATDKADGHRERFTPTLKGYVIADKERVIEDLTAVGLIMPGKAEQLAQAIVDKINAALQGGVSTGAGVTAERYHEYTASSNGTPNATPNGIGAVGTNGVEVTSNQTAKALERA